jgi:putative ABC transport system permease protein
MKIKESPSIILAFHGMLGRKKQTSLLLLLLTLVFSFLTAAVIYSVSSAQVLQDTRCELYGEWQYLCLSDTAADAAQAKNALPASAQVSTVTQNGIVLGADDGVAGGIGTVDDTFAQLGRIVPISGDFPTQPDEIAMTTTLLDALGCSYDVGQTVTLKVAANDYDPLAGSGTVMEKAYTLCGVLPAYDVYWNLNGNLTVSGIVAEPLALDGQKFQTFYYLNAAAPVTASTDPALVANEYAYPQEDTVSSSLRFLLVAAILVSFFAVAQYFLIVLHKRVHTINTFLTLGAKNRDLRLMCLWEALFAGLAAVAAGFALGCGAAAVGLGLQKHLSFLVIPAASLAPLAVLFLLSVLLGALLPAVLVRPQTAKPKEKPAKKFRLAQLPLAPQIGVGCAVLLIAVSCLYVGWRVMLPYDLDAPYACLSIKMNGTSGMPFSLKEDLAALPGVEEVSAAIDLTDTYTVTSDKIRSSQMLADIWVKDNGDIPSLIMQNASKGTLNTMVCALPDDELRRIAADAGVSDEEIETLLAGDSVLTLWRDCYYDPAADEYYQGFQPDGSTLVEPVFAAGDKLSIQYRRYTGQDEAGNEVYRTYTAQLPIAGVVKSASNYTLLTTDRIIFSGTIFVSTALYHKMFESAGSYFMEKEGYSSLNVKLSAGSNFSLRRSISSIATRRNGILRADNYDLISQSYTEGTQSAFLVGILAVFGVLLGCALLVVLNLSAYEVQQQRLSLLLTLGVSPKKLVLSYAKLLLPVIVGTTLLVNIVVYAAVSRIVPIQSILDLIRIHTSGRVFEFHKPVGSQIMVSILLMVFWLSAALLPIFSFIRKKASKGDIL